MVATLQPFTHDRALYLQIDPTLSVDSFEDCPFLYILGN